MFDVLKFHTYQISKLKFKLNSNIVFFGGYRLKYKHTHMYYKYNNI